jgi:hypothetical protein
MGIRCHSRGLWLWSSVVKKTFRMIAAFLSSGNLKGCLHKAVTRETFIIAVEMRLIFTKHTVLQNQTYIKWIVPRRFLFWCRLAALSLPWRPITGFYASNSHMLAVPPLQGVGGIGNVWRGKESRGTLSLLTSQSRFGILYDALTWSTYDLVLLWPSASCTCRHIGCVCPQFRWCTSRGQASLAQRVAVRVALCLSCMMCIKWTHNGNVMTFIFQRDQQRSVKCGTEDRHWPLSFQFTQVCLFVSVDFTRNTNLVSTDMSEVYSHVEYLYLPNAFLCDFPYFIGLLIV